jgi:hypothetical protein
MPTNSNRSFRYLILPGVSFALDTNKDKGTRIAVALCNEIDNFSRETARTLLNMLLDAPDETLRACQLKRNVFWIPYWSDNPNVDVMHPLIEEIRDQLNDRALYRSLRELFIKGAISWEAARDLGQEETKKSSSGTSDYMATAIYKQYKQISDILDTDEKDILKKLPNLEAFEKIFFEWSGSADSILNKIRRFAKKKVEEARKEEKEEKLAEEEFEKLAEVEDVKEETTEEAPATEETETTEEAPAAMLPEN